ncbi:MAG: 50S ribosomal protein L22 [Parcubacteria group bacterium]|nr:50S ribosomal protein L22 [Parcubacteria group bacterium]
MNEVKAQLNSLRMSPRKVRLVVDLLRGLDAGQAKSVLRFVVKKTAKPLLKLLNSATANAEHNFGLNKNNLYVSEIKVDAGRTLKRFRPRAFGRASAIGKRTSKISLVLKEKLGPSLGTVSKVQAVKESSDKKSEKIEKRPKYARPETQEKQKINQPILKKKIFQRKTI